MHIALADRLIADPKLLPAARSALEQAWGAFLLGSIAPDARVSSGLARGKTHFFEYTAPLDMPPACKLLRMFPNLRYSAVADTAQGAFVAGYAAHLAMDAVWFTEMLPHFSRDWAPPSERNILLHMLLGHLDARDRSRLDGQDYLALKRATPKAWLPFISDADLSAWRDLIADQLAPNAPSRTLEILGSRIRMSVDQVQTILADEARMRVLWQNIPPSLIAAVEAAMYENVLQTVNAYFVDQLT
ncbi:MAG: zinc dependent phospholipase C family protein [Anaerolineae bacterium]|nr:zinc dependent phospholipase C family protein [Anaerolineae bacterium]